MDLPSGICWPVWRLATDPRISDSYQTIRDHWTLTEVFEAIAVLDEIAAAENRARERAENERST